MSGRRKKASAGEKALQKVNACEKAAKGYKITPRLDPSTYVESPWNSWTYQEVFTSTVVNFTVSVKLDNLLIQLATQLGLSAISRVRLKVHAAQVWVTAGTALIATDLEAKFYELSQGDQQVRSIQKDRGTWSQAARAGYVYPTVDRSEIYSQTDKDRIVLTTLTPAISSQITCRVQLLWRSLPE